MNELRDLFNRQISRRTLMKGVGAGAMALGTGSLLEACAGTSTSSGGNQSLTWWSLFNKGEPSQVVNQQIIDDFQKAYPNIKVNVLWGGRDVLTKVRAALINGNPPDLVDKDGDEMAAAIINNGQAEPLDDVINSTIYGEQSKLADVIPAGYLDQFKVNGHDYLVPHTVFTSGFFYDGTLFAKLGLTAPTTWDDFLALINALKGKGITPIGSDNPSVLNAYYFYWSAVRYLGAGNLLKVVADKSGRSFDDPLLLQAANDVASLVAMRPFESQYDGSKYPAAEQAFGLGKAGTYLNGDWLPGEIQGTVPSTFQFRMFPYPQVPNGHMSVEIYGIGFSIPKGAKNIDAAKKFISFFMSKKELVGYVTTAQSQVARSDMDAPPSLTDVKKLFDQNLPVNRVYDGLQYQYPGWFQTIFLPLDDKLFYGQLSGPDFISQLKAQTVTYFQSHTT